MIDFARITVIAGAGGNGAGSFVHTKGKRRGKADGGDGGRGGNVYFVASPDLNTLEPFRFIKEYKAQDGGNGLSNKRTGAEGQDREIKVALGTQIKAGGVVYDVVSMTDRILIARGGDGGRGNRHMRDEYGRRPFKGEMGQPGETIEAELELKLIADVGLVGFPNAGKSTLIGTLTSATPKIAPYPFTTLEPNLGVLEFKGKRIVIADIPGLIEGASEGKGLGDLFLRHIERTKIIVHIIDATTDDVTRAYTSIRDELKAYSKELAKKKEIIVLNKSDLVTEETLDLKVGEFSKKRKKVFVISAQNKTGIDALVSEIAKRLL